MRFASFLSGGFITAIVVNPLEKKLAKRTSVHCKDVQMAENRQFMNFNLELTASPFVVTFSFQLPNGEIQISVLAGKFNFFEITGF